MAFSTSSKDSNIANSSRSAQYAMFPVSPRKVAITLFYIIAVLVALSVAGTIMVKALQLKSHFVLDYNNLFNLAHENNVPTLFSFLLLFAASCLNFLIYLLSARHTANRNAKRWLILSIVFLFLSLDESLKVHERLNDLKSYLNLEDSGFFYYAWVIPYGILVVFGGLYFYKFLFSLPEKTKKLFVLSGSIFVGAAIGFELLEGYTVKAYGGSNTYDVVFSTLEETCEMLGVALFIYAMLDYIATFNTVFIISTKDLQKTRLSL